MTTRTIRVLAACSGGGHWEQMMLLRPALDQFATSYATTIEELGTRDGLKLAGVLSDVNRSTPGALARASRRAWRVVREVRPDVVISTGALPGLLCLIAGRAHGARTIWLDSVANAERMSMSGRLASRIVTRCMTQWDHLTQPPTIVFDGALL